MATRRYKTSAGEDDTGVVEEVGAATNSDTVELTVDLATTQVGDGGSTRAITRDEVLAGIDRIKRKILSGNWPPA
jgi:hypothetical protein